MQDISACVCNPQTQTIDQLLALDEVSTESELGKKAPNVGRMQKKAPKVGKRRLSR